MQKLEKIVHATYPKARILSPTAVSLMLEKGNIKFSKWSQSEEDPMVAVLIEFEDQDEMLPESRRRTLVVDMHNETIVTTTG